MLSKEQNEKYYKYILSCIYRETNGKETTPKGHKAKLLFLYKTFISEAITDTNYRSGTHYAFESWIRGLPSCFNIEFENYKILELANKYGSLNKNPTEKDEDKILNNYWNFITMKTFVLFNRYLNPTDF